MLMAEFPSAAYFVRDSRGYLVKLNHKVLLYVYGSVLNIVISVCFLQ